MLDEKVNRLFAGKVVRKNLVRKVKVGANVPVLVLEFLLGKYCASSDELTIQMGLQVVNDTLLNNYIRADESMKAQSDREGPAAATRSSTRSKSASSTPTTGLTSPTSGHKNVHIPEHYISEYERLANGRYLGSGRYEI